MRGGGGEWGSDSRRRLWARGPVGVGFAELDELLGGSSERYEV